MIVAVPGATAVTLPSFTVATFSSDELHSTVFSVAFSGANVATRVTSSPSTSPVSSLSKVTPVTGIFLASTVTAHVAVFPPSAVETVMVVVPGLSAVTFPSDTEATPASEDDQLTALFVALLGETVAVSVSLSPSVKGRVDLLMLTPVTAIVVGGGVTGVSGVSASSGLQEIIIKQNNAAVITAIETQNSFFVFIIY